MYWPVGAPSIFRHDLPVEVLDEESQAKEVQIANGPGKTLVRSATQTIASERPSNHTSLADGTLEQRGKDIRRQSQYGAEGYAEDEIIAIRISRSGKLLATITRHVLTIWQTWPTVVLTAVRRSPQSLKKYGDNVDVLLKPDGTRIVIQTLHDHLIDYALEIEGNERSYRLQYANRNKSHTRRKSINGFNSSSTLEKSGTLMGDGLVPDAALHFQRIIRLDAGISRALALDEDVMIATVNDPAAVQCIRWSLDRPPRTSTEKLTHMRWLQGDKALMDIAYDRPMNMFTWITSEGYAYAVRRVVGKSKDSKSKALFNGHLFHSPGFQDEEATRTAINSKFSMIAVSTISGQIYVYAVHDYAGNITLTRKLDSAASLPFSDRLTSLHYTPDGYALFAGYDEGWCTWSVYGQIGPSSLNVDVQAAERNSESWLTSVRESCWIGNGSELLILPPRSKRFFVQEFARSSNIGYLAPGNVSETLLQTSTGLMVYKGHEMPDLSALSVSSSLWHQVQIPIEYLEEQWPIKVSSISPDGRYVAIAGQRGLAHYSVHSSRWKTFQDSIMQNSFTVRGGMCWYQHVLIAAVEFGATWELRLYSRELPLDDSRVLFVEPLTAPAVHISPSGDDSLLVYTRENVLDHYILKVTGDTVRLAKVGQIAFNGIVNSPPRVRAVSWVVPDHQLQNGDPAQDVATASVIFLVDGKLVSLQPNLGEDGELKYEMRVLAQEVEHYLLARDGPSKLSLGWKREDGTVSPSEAYSSDFNNALQDSLWLFDGRSVKMWTDVQDLLASSANEYLQEPQTPVDIPVDFYPLSLLLDKGMLLGVESELTQRRDLSFAFFRTVARTALFLSRVLRSFLAQYDSPAALHLSHNYKHLPYFPHALEILLHDVLVEEMENESSEGENALLPTVLSFLSSFPEYLDVVVQCTRKTEVRYWRTLFAHLPPPEELFETSLQRGSLKTAGGYLLILHTLSEVHSASPQMVRLLRRAQQEQDWDLCKELARFLMALDESGGILRDALALAEKNRSGNVLQVNGDRPAEISTGASNEH